MYPVHILTCTHTINLDFPGDDALTGVENGPSSGAPEFDRTRQRGSTTANTERRTSELQNVKVAGFIVYEGEMPPF